MIKKIIKYFRRKYWILGFCTFENGLVTGDKKIEVKYIKGLPGNKWYADPFILDVNDKTIEILVEEYTYAIAKGRIAHISIDKKTLKLLSEKIILDLPTHLSFPAIIRDGNNIFIYPENSQSGESNFYKYDTINNILTFEGCIVREPLTDAVIFNYENDKFIFSTKVPNENTNCLLIYKENEKKKIELYQKYYFENKTARNAGDILRINNKYYRVAQNCSKIYGGGVIFQEIIFENGSFRFNSINEIAPFKDSFALHTFNTYKNLCVIDVSKARFPIINKIIDKFSRIKHKLI